MLLCQLDQAKKFTSLSMDLIVMEADITLTITIITILSNNMPMNLPKAIVDNED